MHRLPVNVQSPACRGEYLCTPGTFLVGLHALLVVGNNFQHRVLGLALVAVYKLVLCVPLCDHVIHKILSKVCLVLTLRASEYPPQMGSLSVLVEGTTHTTKPLGAPWALHALKNTRVISQPL